MDSARSVRISRLLSLILRHEPKRFGLTLDAAGWVPVHYLLHALARNGEPVSLEDLFEIVRRSEKHRFALNEDGSLIRASHGHSVPVRLGYQPETPPPVLFHGTTSRSLPGIRKEGVKRKARLHVHLSENVDEAVHVGSRRGTPVILQVDAKGMFDAGFAFFRSASGVWLTDAVPVAFLTFPTEEEDRDRSPHGPRPSPQRA